MHKIYVARPINSKWLGDFPENWIGLQDLKTRINFNGAFIGEQDEIELINRLLDEGKVLDENASKMATIILKSYRLRFRFNVVSLIMDGNH